MNASSARRAERRWMRAAALVTPVQAVRLSRTRSSKEYEPGSVLSRNVAMRGGYRASHARGRGGPMAGRGGVGGGRNSRDRFTSTAGLGAGGAGGGGGATWGFERGVSVGDGA